MYRLPKFPPESPISLSPSPASPIYDFQQDRSPRPCSPASSVGSHASGISHPSGERKRRRITLENVSSSELLNSVVDWDDGQKSRQSLPKIGPEDSQFSNPIWAYPGDLSFLSAAGRSDLDSQTPPLSTMPLGRTLNGTSGSGYGDDHVSLSSPPDLLSLSRSISPATIDPELGSRSQAKKRKVRIDTAQRFRNRKTNEAIVKQEISRLQLIRRLRLMTKQRDSYHKERDDFRERLGRHFGTQRVPLRPASPCNYTSTAGQSDNHPLLSPPEIHSQSDLPIPNTIDLKSGPGSQAERRKEANREAQRRFRIRKRNEAILEQTTEQLTEQLDSVIEQRDFYRSERDFFSEELGRYLGARLRRSRPLSPPCS